MPNVPAPAVHNPAKEAIAHSNFASLVSVLDFRLRTLASIKTWLVETTAAPPNNRCTRSQAGRAEVMPRRTSMAMEAAESSPSCSRTPRSAVSIRDDVQGLDLWTRQVGRRQVSSITLAGGHAGIDRARSLRTTAGHHHRCSHCPTTEKKARHTAASSDREKRCGLLALELQRSQLLLS